MIGLNGDIPFSGEQPRLSLPPRAEAAAPMIGLNGDIPFSGELKQGVRECSIDQQPDFFS
jgi:hypothetical protein